VGASSWTSSVAGSSSDRKRSGWRTVWANTNSAYSTTDAIAANVSCVGVKVGPGELVVSAGRTRQTVASVMTVANAVAVPSALNVATCRLRVNTTRQSPTTPLHVIIAAAKTVSRARLSVSDPPDAISVTMSPASMTVTATARISDPSGSPTRCATTSAWYTDVRTAPASTIATATRTASPGLRPHVAASASRATTGTMSNQGTVRTSSRVFSTASPIAENLRAESLAVLERALSLDLGHGGGSVMRDIQSDPTTLLRS
jgi:hypothetical protein